MNERKLNLYIPQWQGSGPTDELYFGAAALKEYTEAKGVTFTDIPIAPLTPGTELKVERNIMGYSGIVSQLMKIRDVLLESAPGRLFTVGGGCGIEIPLVSYLKERHGPMDVIWFDAHGDLNSPDSSPSKYFHGMPLRFLMEEIGNNEISDSFMRIQPDELTMVGIRDLDPPEEQFIRKKEIRVLSVKEWKSIGECLVSGRKKVYLHIDLDVLDPRSYRNVKCPARHGLSIEELSECITLIGEKREIIGMSLLENTEREKQKIKLLDGLIKKGLSL